MPRHPRIEYAGAVYHVMCRGDRREAIVETDEDRHLFIETLGQACERSGWIVHSYVLMNNHYHVLLETPEGGLVDGMRWFQTTYTARYNARKRMCGHLFQGRYKAIVLDPADPAYVRIASDYIHLNPARAHMLKKAHPRLEEYPWSSYPAYIGKDDIPDWLETERVLDSHGTTGEEYRRYMQGRAKEAIGGSKEMEREWKAIRRGWYLGGETFREEMVDRIGDRMARKKRESYSGAGVKGHDEKTAKGLLAKGLEALKTGQEEVKSWKTTDVRKQALTWLIRSSTMASSEWISEHIGMGHRSNISRATRRIQNASGPSELPLKRKMLQCKD